MTNARQGLASQVSGPAAPGHSMRQNQPQARLVLLSARRRAPAFTVPSDSFSQRTWWSGSDGQINTPATRHGQGPIGRLREAGWGRPQKACVPFPSQPATIRRSPLGHPKYSRCDGRQRLARNRSNLGALQMMLVDATTVTVAPRARARQMRFETNNRFLIGSTSQ